MNVEDMTPDELRAALIECIGRLDLNREKIWADRMEKAAGMIERQTVMIRRLTAEIQLLCEMVATK